MIIIIHFYRSRLLNGSFIPLIYATFKVHFRKSDVKSSVIRWDLVKANQVIHSHIWLCFHIVYVFLCIWTHVYLFLAHVSPSTNMRTFVQYIIHFCVNNLPNLLMKISNQTSHHFVSQQGFSWCLNVALIGDNETWLELAHMTTSREFYSLRSLRHDLLHYRGSSVPYRFAVDGSQGSKTPSARV